MQFQDCKAVEYVLSCLVAVNKFSKTLLCPTNVKENFKQNLLKY
jgi:hypothetical protein